VRARGGLVVEVGCGSGLLTRYLTDAGHRVVATDASPAMLELAREFAPDTVETYRLTLPDDPIPPADAVVAIGHPLNYLADEASVGRALVAIAESLQPGGVVAVDLCDLEWAEARRNAPPVARIRDDWAIITEFEIPAPNRFVRRIATFVRNDDATWRRDDERHDNVLIETADVPDLLAEHGVEATVTPSFGDEQLPTGLYAVVGRRLATA
jgi:SAM-dependent methyltransferase